ncbi:MAG: oligosaccharide flippase family protein, partial [Gemmatimonadetes bacterium]|nr:oligosaccharide flippase family protein [Gemmatimonadota bacterium]
YSATRLLSHVGHNLDRVLVAFFHGPRTTGLYDNAYRWAHYPVLQVFPPLITVAVSSLSRARETAGGYAAGIHLGLLSVLSVALPGLAFMAREAPLVILVLLGNQWVETIPLFRWLSVAAFAKALMMGTRWIYLSEGRTGDQLRWAAIDTIVFVVAVSVGVTRGAFGVAVAFTAAACLLAGPAIAYCLRGSDVTPEQYLSAIWRPAVASLAAMAALVVLGDAIPRIGESVGSLSLRLVPYGLVYALAWVLLPGGPREARRLGRLLTELLRR